MLSRHFALLTLGASLVLSADNSAYNWRLPPGFRPPPGPADNPMNEAKVELGRRLFYDQRNRSEQGRYGSLKRPKVNDLIAVEKIAQWQKLKTLVLDSVSSPITKDCDWGIEECLSSAYRGLVLLAIATILVLKIAINQHLSRSDGNGDFVGVGNDFDSIQIVGEC
jgi:hypothetical protein